MTELAEEEYPSEGHEGYTEGVVVPGHFPAHGEIHRAFDGE